MSDNHRGLPHDLPEYVPNVPPSRFAPPVKPVTVLMVGGPADGTWRVTKDRKITFSSLDTDALIAPFERYQYRVERIALFDWQLNVAVCDGEFKGSKERNRAIARALLQRDVATAMGVL